MKTSIETPQAGENHYQGLSHKPIEVIPVSSYELRVTRRKALPSADVRQAFIKSAIENGIRGPRPGSSVCWSSPKGRAQA
ncbi:MAG: hypothetical protein FWG12_06850 [Holophagaceae bacterium]|nr:hypothetical protein [Holophagaceae bacterium]